MKITCKRWTDRKSNQTRATKAGISDFAYKTTKGEYMANWSDKPLSNFRHVKKFKISQ